MFAIKLCANAPDRELVTVIKLQATEDYGTGDTCTNSFLHCSTALVVLGLLTVEVS